jgi:hypothetical protein
MFQHFFDKGGFVYEIESCQFEDLSLFFIDIA